MTAALEQLLEIEVEATEAANSPGGSGSPACHRVYFTTAADLAASTDR